MLVECTRIPVVGYHSNTRIVKEQVWCQIKGSSFDNVAMVEKV